jgi:hypothetical protein
MFSNVTPALSLSSARNIEYDFCVGRESFRGEAFSGMDDIRRGICGGAKLIMDMLGLRFGAGFKAEGAAARGRDSEADAE